MTSEFNFADYADMKIEHLPEWTVPDALREIIQQAPNKPSINPQMKTINKIMAEQRIGVIDLADGLGSPDSTERLGTLMILRRIEYPDIQQRLYAGYRVLSLLLHDPRPKIRLTCVQLISALGLANKAHPAFDEADDLIKPERYAKETPRHITIATLYQSAVSEADPDVLQAVLDLLGRYLGDGSADLVDKLMQQATDPQTRATIALMKLQGRGNENIDQSTIDIDALCDALTYDALLNPIVITKLAELGDSKLLDAMLKAMDSDLSDKNRADIARALGATQGDQSIFHRLLKSDDDRVYEGLELLVDDESPTVRWGAVDGLANLNNDDAISILQPLLATEPNQQVRHALILAIAKWRYDEEIYEQLMDVIHNGTVNQQVTAIRSLIHFPKYIDQTLNILSDRLSKGNAPSTIVSVLVELGDERAIPKIIGAVRGGRIQVSEGAKALEKLGVKNATNLILGELNDKQRNDYERGRRLPPDHADKF